MPAPSCNLIVKSSLKRGPAVLVLLAIAFLVGDPGASAQVPAGLDPLAYRYPAQLQSVLTSFGTAVREDAVGRYASALASMPGDAAASLTSVPDHIAYFRAKANLNAGRAGEALELIKGFHRLYPDSPELTEAALVKAKACLALSDPAGALAALDSGQVKNGADVLCLRGEALESLKRRPEAIRIYLQAYTEFVGSPGAGQAERRLRILSPTFLTRAENRDAMLRRSGNLIRAGRSTEARALLLKLIAAPVPGRSTDELYLLLADADTNLSRLTEALQYLRNTSNAALGAQVNYLKGVCFRGLDRESAFLETRDRAVKEFAESPFTEKLLYSIATYYDVASRVEAARQAYEALLHGFPKGEYAERALWRAATLNYAEGRYEEALQAFLQYLYAGPTLGSASASGYWMGRCYERIGDFDKAASCYRQTQALANTSYYGMRARDALASMNALPPTATHPSVAIDYNATIQQLESLRPVTTGIPQPDTRTLQVIERTRQLAAAGLPDLALDELEHALPTSGGRDKILYYAMARIYLSKSDNLSAIISIRRAFPDYNYLPPSYLPHEMWDLLFPTRHLDSVTRHANGNQVDPNLVLALIRQESAFNESARSKSNARGLMQVLPTTGRSLARQAGIAPYTLAKLHEPDTNIALGTRYLSGRLQKYGGKVELALAAYNAGDYRVDQWLQEFGNVDMAEFVERIPFSETRQYVKQVMSNRAHYQLRSGTSPALAPRLP